jgi:4'-phosphopantetheinyl transferase
LIESIVFSRTERISAPAALGETEAHLWAIRLGGDLSAQSAIFSPSEILSMDERRRAARFRFERDRNRFVASHVFLRRVLASYADANPAGLEFTVSGCGKPALTAYDDLHFNLSHAGDLAVCAVARSPVGIDIETVRPIADRDAMASRYFTERERETVETLPPDRQSLAFLEIWTRKEAVLKGEGIGLAGLSNEELSARWAAFAFALCEGTVGAIATAHAVKNVIAMLLCSQTS